MNVSQLCNRNVVTVRKSDEIPAAARVMREKHVGYLVVVEADFNAATQRPIGVLTDRDIVVAVVAQDVNPRGLTVGDIMTSSPVVVELNDSIAAAVQEMRRIGVRRMPVVGSLGELAGVLSLDDVLDALANELHNLAGAIRNERRVETALRT
ncbi:MAG TPA: CBS domain-containing protein [Steroidobacteraceae bacterium]|nr:CBS domain-containing protein [Steroidobacteraceae bacterium]